MLKRSILFLLFFLPVVATVRAQTDAQFSMYWALPSYMNPAAVAADDHIRVAALNRMQWVGISNAPKTFFVTAEMPFRFMKKNQAVGVMVTSDKAGLFSTNNFALQYAYHLKLWEGRLSLGVRLGIIDQAFDGTKVDIPDTPDQTPGDDSIPRASVSAMEFDAGVGAWYSHRLCYDGISSTHMSAPTLELDEKSYAEISRIYYLTAGCNIVLRNSLYELQPSFLVKSDFQFTQVDLSLRMTYNKMFWGGISYRWSDAVIFMAGVEIKGVRFGYAYDLSTSSIASVSRGTHELFGSSNLKMDFSPKTRNKNQSIRD